MQLYFSPLACSLATRISFYEAGVAATFTEVDTKHKRTLDGAPYLEINPLGLVPALRTDTGEILTENSAILQYVADHVPGAELAPREGLARTRLQQWLCFIGTELHKGLFVPLLDPNAPDAMKQYVSKKHTNRLDYLEAQLRDREFLLDRFSVADAYLFAVLNWSRATPVNLAQWPVISAYYNRLAARPSIAKALGEEFELYQREQARRKLER